MNKCEHQKFKLLFESEENLTFICIDCKSITSIYASDLDLSNQENLGEWKQFIECKSCGSGNYE
ncbi:hypothetical protein [Spiroplasma ixodetis]|uniref:hypothetical protein n=1 Tax=Spiroplasma ixodetis TaxID=2141 RepID=UPI00257511A4|nr:hypothetical protein [Spiroplasma ixodetis]WJG69625.1 hypothetical protein SIXOD_v1c05350 [Spiroplasma ixodetis Y32]WJG70691.1 hypothetical protein SIXOD_v1c19060 [Spiroplasma ixodetis Y32]WJG71188.1 hypothetical protein SIXOD_v1c25490 [Spiroplasma ixodetis Y32]